jgi:oligopeptide transport system substrate-binding protein
LFVVSKTYQINYCLFISLIKGGVLMKSRKLLTTLLAALLATSVLAGCGKANNSAGSGTGTETKEPTKTEEPAPAPKEQKLVLREGAMKTMDPSLGTDQVSFDVIQNTQETLLVSNNDKPDAGAAEKWEVSEDGKTWTFTLRAGLKWSDGKPLTAKDYEYSWKRILNPETGAAYSFFLFPVKNGEEYYAGKAKAEDLGIKAKDDTTFVVELARPVPYFDQIAMFPALAPIREDIATAQKEKFGTDAATMVYSGPFTVAQWQRGAKIVLKKNPNYWNAANIKLETVELAEVAEMKTAYEMFNKGELDATGGSGEYLTKMQEEAKSGKYNHITGVSPSSFYMLYNTTGKGVDGKENKALTSPKVRLALSLALNREEYTSAVFKRGLPAYGIVPKTLAIGADEYRGKVEEPLLALKDKDPKALLVEGLNDLKLDPDPSKYTFDYLTQGSDADSKKYAEYFQNTWQQKLGVKITITNSADFADYLGKTHEQQFEIAMSGWGADYNDPMTFLDLFSITNGNNNGKFENKEYEDLLKKVQNETDQAKRLEMFKRMETIVVAEQAAVAPIYYRDTHSFQQKHVKGLQLPLFGGSFQLRWASVE